MEPGFIGHRMSSIFVSNSIDTTIVLTVMLMAGKKKMKCLFVDDDDVLFAPNWKVSINIFLLPEITNRNYCWDLQEFIAKMWLSLFLRFGMDTCSLFFPLSLFKSRRRRRRRRRFGLIVWLVDAMHSDRPIDHILSHVSLYTHFRSVHLKSISQTM